jgi:hypothetical protein
MIGSVALVLLLATEPATTTLPRQPDVPRDRPVEQTGSRESPGAVTDYLFDKPLSATDDPAFIANALVGVRQGVLDARDAGGTLQSASLRAAAEKIGKQNEATARVLEALARKKGWHLPERVTQDGALRAAHDTPRASADFIINQIAFHQATLEQFRAQLGGKGDAELKRAVSSALPGYRRNLELLLTLKP